MARTCYSNLGLTTGTTGVFATFIVVTGTLFTTCIGLMEGAAVGIEALASWLTVSGSIAWLSSI